MKFFISADIEGVAGVASGDQLMPSNFEWQCARKWMTSEVLAAVHAARAEGADEVIVADSHGTGENILIDELPGFVRIVRSGPRPLMMMQGIEEPGIKACALIGYHASSWSATGLLAHTNSTAINRTVKLNGVVASEAYIYAAVAGHYGIPVVTISGDQACIDEVKLWMIGAQAVAVKTAVSRLSTLTVTPERSRVMIGEAVAAGIRKRGSIAPFRLDGPIDLDIEFVHRTAAETLAYISEFARIDAYTVRYRAGSVPDAVRALAFTTYYAAAGIKPYGT